MIMKEEPPEDDTRFDATRVYVYDINKSYTRRAGGFYADKHYN